VSVFLHIFCWLIRSCPVIQTSIPPGMHPPTPILFSGFLAWFVPISRVASGPAAWGVVTWDQEYTDLEWWGLEVKTRSSSRRHVQDVIRRLVKLYCTLASNTCNQNRIVIFTLSDVWRERSDRTELIYVATFNWIKKSIARHFTDDKKLSYR